MADTNAQDPPARRTGNPEAARVIWSHGNEHERRRTLTRRARRQALVRGGISVVLAAALFLVGWRIVASIACAVGVITLLAGLLSPLGAHRLLDRLFHALVTGVGHLMTWLALTPVFVLVFIPYGLLFRRGRKDHLRRWFDPDAGSYWTLREPSTDRAARHQRQF